MDWLKVGDYHEIFKISNADTNDSVRITFLPGCAFFGITEELKITLTSQIIHAIQSSPMLNK